MAVINARSRFAVTVVGLTVSLSACTVHKTDVPSLSGPSGLANPGITITVSPDVLTQDGVSQSLVTITATNSNGQPAANVQLRSDIAVAGTVTDFGRLSAKSLVTDGNGHATTVYTAPPAPQIVVGNGTKVDIQVTPVGSNFDNNNLWVASLMLVPPGVVVSQSPLVPDFTPPTPNAGDVATFTATVTDPSKSGMAVASYAWDFGDGSTGSGQTVTHTFRSTGTNIVTLTITDNLGHIASVTHPVTIGAATALTPTFFTTPASPGVAQPITFNASQTTPPAGHTITGYFWDFGDGNGDSGVVVTHSYSTAGTYTALLRVTLDNGAQGTSSQAITVGIAGPTAKFTLSPTPPVPANTSINFNASQSSAQPGRTIASYSWDFGDGTSGSGVNVSHSFSVPGQTYQVTLTVTDSAGQTGFLTQPVAILSDAPTALFTVTPPSPTAPTGTDTVVLLDAANSFAASGRTIASYNWTVTGSNVHSNPAGGAVQSLTLRAPGVYAVTLTVTDNAGKTGSQTQNITVTGS